MKTKFIYILLTFVVGTNCLYSQSSNRNYITTRTYTNDAGTTYLDQIQYFDDLGRLVQTVQRGITPSNKDLVVLSEYTASGKDSVVWLPAVVSGYNGAYISPATIKSNAITANSDQNPYSKQTNNYSINTTVTEFGPGQAWHNNNWNTSTTQHCNSGMGSSSVFAGIDLYIEGQSVKRRSDLPMASSYVNHFSKENGNWGTEHTNKKGQLTRIFTVNSGVAYNTYYVHDDYGNLRYVIPPKAAELLDSRTVINESDADAAELIYVYKYDKRNRCIWKRLPGCEPIYYVYDKADRLILTQDGEQRLKSEWTFTIPDALGRIVLTGICKNSINYAAEDPINIVVKATSDQTNIAYKYYSLNYTLTSPTILSANYYDNYDFIVKESFTKIPYDATQYNTRYGDETVANKYKHKGLLTGTITALLDGSGTFLYKTMFYDQRKQLIQAHSTSHLSGGIDKEYFAYNFTGQLTQKKHIHIATGNSNQTEEYNYTYDHAGRPTKTTHKLNVGSLVTLTENSYDELGRLKTNKKGGNTNLESSYTFNVRSWIKTITNPLYEQTLYYNDSYNGSSGRYGGDVTAMEWQVQGDIKRAYTFAYDNISRLTSANYFVNGATNTNYKTAYSYDKHGNILTLQRYGKTSASAYGLIDNLTMTYNGNQLTKVEDAVGTISLAESADFKNYSNFATEYMYNKNGAMTKDLNKGISDIQYNFLNLPKQIDIKSPVAEARNEYIYSADREKVKVIKKWNPNYSTAPVIGSAINTTTLTQSITIDYIGNFIYENNSLKRILVDGGYIEAGVYYFYLNDHLGNNRVVANQSGAIIQKNHYYPFGMSFAENTVAEQGKQPYKYNGKELDQMHGANLYDFGNRLYDPAINRFQVPDRYAEKYYSMSPYQYAANNPMKNIDVNGDSIWISTSDGNLLYQNGTLFSRGEDGELSEYRGRLARIDKKTGNVKGYKGILGATVGDLDKLRNGSDFANHIITTLQSSNFNFTIKPKYGAFNSAPVEIPGGRVGGVNNNAYAFQVLEQGGPLVDFAPFDNIGSGGIINWDPKASGGSMITLGHELGHAYDASFGLLDSRRVHFNGGIEEIREIRAVYYENRIRQDFGMKLREKYSDSGPRLLDSNNNPIFYPVPMLKFLRLP